MATFSHLPTELLTLIFHLSNDGEPATGSKHSTRSRFSLISRACFRAVPAADNFYVVGGEHAKGLITKLEREREWMAQEGRRARSARTTRSALPIILRVTTIRLLILIVHLQERGEVFASLLRTIPNLITLRLFAYDSTYGAVAAQPESFASLGDAVGALVSLKELEFGISQMKIPDILRILVPLKALEVLILGINTYIDGDQYQSLLPHLSLTSVSEATRSLSTTPSSALSQPPLPPGFTL